MKKHYKIIAVLLFVLNSFPFLTSAQVTFQKIYPSVIDQSGRDVVATSDGGYLIVGMTTNYTPNDSDLLVIKTNYLGDTLWTKKYGGPQAEYANAIIPTYDGNYFILGFTRSFGSGSDDTWLVKMDPYGNILWTQTYGSTGIDDGNDIIATWDGNYVITGRTNNNAHLFKIDPSGNVIWTKTYGGAQYENSHSVKQCLDGGYILTGQTRSYGQGLADIYIVKTNSFGDTLWTKTYGGAGMDDGNSIIANSDGTYIICAETNSAGGYGDYDIQMIKTDSYGNGIWNKRYGGQEKDI